MKPAIPTACALQREATAGEAHAPELESSPRLSKLERKPMQQ